MKNNRKTMEDFVMIPRKASEPLSAGKMSFYEWVTLQWIFMNTNPFNGYVKIGYKGLCEQLKNVIKYDNARKIVSSLKRKKFIHYTSHRGKAGSFHIYPIGYCRTSGKIQTLENICSKKSSGNKSQPEHNPSSNNHNLESMKKALVDKLSTNKPKPKITTTYNNTNNETDNTIDKKIVSVKSFKPKNSEESRCLDIANDIGEKDMRFILSRLRDCGLGTIERAYGILNEIPDEKIKKSRAQLFNHLIYEANSNFKNSETGGGGGCSPQ